MAWHGQAVPLYQVLFRPQHSLIDQSLHSRLGAETTNGDGFGVGWYDQGHEPGVYKITQPAWSDENLRHLAGHITSHTFLAHIRATTGTPVQRSNCHPFSHGRWLFVHNGVVEDVHRTRRDLMLAIAPELFAEVQGSTDSEILFFLALTFGLADDPIGALEATIGLVEAVGHEHDVRFPFQGSMCATDGESVWAVRYSSEGRSRTLFTSTDVSGLRQMYPDHPGLRQLGDTDRLVVSEPLADLPGAWREVPEATAVTVHPGGELEERRFTPGVPARA
jgi:glutamine amidotransferase